MINLKTLQVGPYPAKTLERRLLEVQGARLLTMKILSNDYMEARKAYLLRCAIECPKIVQPLFDGTWLKG